MSTSSATLDDGVRMRPLKSPHYLDERAKRKKERMRTSQKFQQSPKKSKEPAHIKRMEPLIHTFEGLGVKNRKVTPENEHMRNITMVQLSATESSSMKVSRDSPLPLMMNIDGDEQMCTLMPSKQHHTYQRFQPRMVPPLNQTTPVTMLHQAYKDSLPPVNSSANTVPNSMGYPPRSYPLLRNSHVPELLLCDVPSAEPRPQGSNYPDIPDCSDSLTSFRGRKSGKSCQTDDLGADALAEIKSDYMATSQKPAQEAPEVNPEWKDIPVMPHSVQNGDDIKSLINNILDTNGILYYQVMRSPDMENVVEIIGKDVEKLSTELSLVAANKGYDIITRDADFGLEAERTPLIANWIELCSGITATGTFGLGVDGKHLSVIDAIMQGRDGKRIHHQIEYFGMTTAHSFLTEEQNRKLMASTQHFTGVHHEVILQAYEKDYYMSIKGIPDIDIVGTPRLLYKYWIPRNVQGEWAVMQDIVFFKLDQDQIRSRGLFDSSNIDVTVAAEHQQTNQETFISSILSLEDLRGRNGSRICCAGKSGKLIEGPDICQAGHTIGHHLAFILDGNERLKEGDCGSFLSLELRDNGRVPILGMFIGQLKSDSRVHQAVILSWNIRQVEATPELKISDMKLPEASSDSDETRTVDAGYWSLRK